jgi:hypothetical protein
LPGWTRYLRMLAASACIAVAACDDPGPPQAVASVVPARVAAPAAATPVLPPDAVSVAPPAEFGRYPALAAAVEAAAAEARSAFEADARAAAARGEDVDGWTLRVDWRVLRNNRYLWLAEGEGAAVRGAGRSTPVHVRLVYDGIGKQVLAFGEWFAPGAWPDVLSMLSAQIPETMHPPSAEAWRRLAYEPIHRPEGQVMRFDVLLPPADGGEPLRVPVPRDAMDAWIDDDRRILLDATAAGP